ncbi:MAG: VPLPA-CTERM sorting domain-containing protein [Thiogranum sp.]
MFAAKISSRGPGAFIGGGTPVPLPAAVWLFGSGLLGLFGIARRRRS